MIDRTVTLYRLQRIGHDGKHRDTRILGQYPAAARLEARWLTWPSTARVVWSTTVTRWTEREGQR